MTATADTAPITPQQAEQARQEAIPSFVFAAFNELITSNLSNGRAEILQKDVVARIRTLSGGQFEQRWLDVEEAYAAQGWQVGYDKPGFNERGHAYFVFTAAS